MVEVAVMVRDKYGDCSPLPFPPSPHWTAPYEECSTSHRDVSKKRSQAVAKEGVVHPRGLVLSATGKCSD